MPIPERNAPVFSPAYKQEHCDKVDVKVTKDITVYERKESINVPYICVDRSKIERPWECSDKPADLTFQQEYLRVRELHRDGDTHFVAVSEQVISILGFDPFIDSENTFRQLEETNNRCKRFERLLREEMSTTRNLIESLNDVINMTWWRRLKFLVTGKVNWSEKNAN